MQDLRTVAQAAGANESWVQETLARSAGQGTTWQGRTLPDNGSRLDAVVQGAPWERGGPAFAVYPGAYDAVRRVRGDWVVQYHSDTRVLRLAGGAVAYANRVGEVFVLPGLSSDGSGSRGTDAEAATALAGKVADQLGLAAPTGVVTEQSRSCDPYWAMP